MFIILLILIIIILVFLEFNPDYILLNIPKSLNNKNGILYIASHNYEHKDIFITFKQFQKFKNEKFYMLFADKTWNYLIEPFRPNNIEFIYVKEKTVEYLSSKLLLGHNIIMFYYFESLSTGPYYIIKNTKCPLLLLKIKKQKKTSLVYNHYNSNFTKIYLNNFMSKFYLEIQKIKYNYERLTNCSNFLSELKDKLYS